MLRILAAALALLAVAAPSAAAHDAEIFATDNTATITDPRDPRLDDHLKGFARRVERIIDDGGARPRGSELLDGVFFGDELTFERSRRFTVDKVSDDELDDIAETIRRRFLQQSVLTFDPDGPVDAVLLDVPGVSARALQKGLTEDQEARERLFGGSVTLDRHLLLVAALEDAQFARGFAKRIGGDLKRARTSYGARRFVDVATDGRARIEKRTLHITGTPGDDTLAIHENEIDFGNDGVIDFEPIRRRYDRVKIDLGDGVDKLIHEGTGYDDTDRRPRPHRRRVRRRERRRRRRQPHDRRHRRPLGGPHRPRRRRRRPRPRDGQRLRRGQPELRRQLRPAERARRRVHNASPATSPRTVCA